MTIQPINRQLTFKQRQRFIDGKTYEHLKSVLTKMNNETNYSSNGYTFETTITKRLVSTKNKLGKTLELTDDRLFLHKKTPLQQLTSNSLLTIGKTELVINNKTGEIIDFYKPFFTTWKNIMKKVSECISIFDSNFNNPDIVKKKKINITGFTQKGCEILFNGKK